MTKHLIRTAALLCCALAFSSCALFNKKKSGSGGYGSDSDSVGGTPLPDRQEGVSFTGDNVDRHKFAPVHFAFDSYAINQEDEPTLQQVASFLSGGSGTVIIAGFTDERGTPEYNRTLGERRAEAVREYLLSHGANAGRIQTVSFGAEMPVDPSSNEGAWAKNRRAEFGVPR